MQYVINAILVVLLLYGGVSYAGTFLSTYEGDNVTIRCDKKGLYIGITLEGNQACYGYHCAYVQAQIDGGEWVKYSAHNGGLGFVRNQYDTFKRHGDVAEQLLGRMLHAKTVSFVTPFGDDRIQFDISDKDRAGLEETHAQCGMLASAKTSIKSNAEIPSYTILSTENLSYGRRPVIVRFKYTVQLNSTASRDEIRAISRKLISEAPPHNAISVFFYLPDTHTKGPYTAGRATWAPNGEWGDAGEKRTGNYSEHSLVVNVGSAMGPAPPSTIVQDIPEKKRREIFVALVKVQDASMGDNEASAAAYYIVAEEFSVSDKVVRKIVMEGVRKGWL